MKKEKNKNGDLYYRYLLVYVENVLYSGEVADVPIKISDQFFRLKEGSLGWADRYMGTNVERIKTTDVQVVR